MVTGAKFGRTLKDTATSVGLLSGADIEDQVLITAEDAYDQLVNVNVAGANNRFVIRGIPFDNVNGAGFGQLGTLYVDGVRLGDKSTAFGPDMLWDVRSVEVLRGAQSTLQGRNALAGAIYLNTNDPTYSFDARARVIAAEGDDYSASIAVGGPIIDDVLAFRLTADHHESRGFIYNPVLKEDADLVDDYQYRAKLLFEPSQDLTVRAVVNYADINRSAASSDTRALGADGFLPRSASQVPGFEAGIAGQGDAGRRQTFSNIADFELNKTLAAAVTVDYDISTALTLTSETTYSDTDDFEQDDPDTGIYNYTGLRTPTVALLNPYGIGDFDYVRAGTVAADPIAIQQEDFEIFSQEFRLKYDAGGRLRYLLGAYYTQEREREDNFSLLVFRNVRNLIIDTARGQGLPAATAAQFASFYPDDVALYTFNAQPVDVENHAVYGEVDFDLSDRLTLNAGLRYDSEDNTSGVVTSGEILGLANPATLPIPALRPLAAAIGAALDPFVEATSTSELSFDAWLPKVGIRYDVDSSLTLGAVAQRAYRAGGVSVNVVRQLVTELAPEFTTNYEVYARKTLGDFGRISANVFYVDWKDQQVTVDLSTRQNDQVGANAGQSELYGFEVEFEANLTPEFKLNGGLGYSHTEFVSFDIQLPASTAGLGLAVDPAGLDGLEGNSFANAPEWSAVLAGSWTRGPMFASGSVNYQDESFSDTGNTRVNDARTLVNLRAGYDFGQVRASVFARNVFDVEYVAGQDAFRPLLGDPRVVGLVLEARY
ncbi:hypothetical protein BZG35_01105 [Brevundimonas sp. LM2]|uniref:TonB-dependent receptor n=1 Tax=Brevundimonas sp. LM2 TaxID=1938605 RepID=UPI00098403D7|nr:TonB-dependent receptor [Brevundimonas sp. LM2]AQR60409.1 hypothetical protein BZG35_01105 [Brevundimonas sp. LM2]